MDICEYDSSYHPEIYHFTHGFAGDLAAQDGSQAGLIASDIIEALPEAFRLLQSR